MNPIKILRKSQNLSQKELAITLDATQAAVSQWENGITKPDLIMLEKLSNHFNISIDTLLGRSTTYEIPVLGTVVAGVPEMVEENILDYIEVNPKLAKNGDHFALYVKGASMQPVLTEGDTIIVKKCPDVESGKLAIVIINGDEGTVKQVWKTPNGITLTAYNPSVYQPTSYTNEEIENIPIIIAGEVVESRRNFSYSENTLTGEPPQR